MSERQHLKSDDVEPDITVEADLDTSRSSHRIRHLFREPGNIASVAVIVALVCIGIASGAAYYNHSPGKLAARFVVLSDYGTGGDIQDQVAKQLAKTIKDKEARFILALGNNVYDSGIASTDDPLWDQNWRDVYYKGVHKIQKRHKWYAGLGDVDYKGNVSAMLDYTVSDLNKDSIWRMPDRNFAIRLDVQDGDPAYIMVLDTVGMMHPNGADVATDAQAKQLADQDGSESIEWLRSMLAAHGGENVLVAGHHPVYVHVDPELGTSDGRYQTDKANRGMESLEAMISKAGVQSYFSGHLPLMDCLSHNGVDYYLAGTGGCATSQGRPMTCSVNGRTVIDKPNREFASRKAGFMLVEVSVDTMEVSFIDAHGNTMFKKSQPRKKTTKNTIFIPE